MQLRFISTKASILNTCMCVCAYYVKVTINSNLAAKKYITHFACALALAMRVTHDRQGGIHAYTYVVSQLLAFASVDMWRNMLLINIFILPLHMTNVFLLHFDRFRAELDPYTSQRKNTRKKWNKKKFEKNKK